MDNFNQTNGQEPGNNKSKMGLICLLVCVVAIIAIAAGYFMKNNNPKAIYNAQLDKLFAYEEKTGGDVTKTTVDFGVNVDTDIKSDIIDLLNGTKVSLDVESSKSQSDAIVGLKLLSENKEIFDADVKLESESKNAYINLGKIFKKTIEVDASEIFESMDKEAEDPLNFLQKVNLKKAELIAKKEIEDQLKDEYFSSENVEVDGVKLKKNVLTLTESQLKEVIDNICDNLSNNQEFLGCFENPDDIKKSLKDVKDELKDQMDESITYEIAIYTNGFKKEIKKVDCAMKADDSEMLLEVKKVSDEDYTYKVSYGKELEEVVSGDIKYQKVSDNEFNLKANVNLKEEDVKFGFDLHSKVEYTDKFSEFNKKDAVKLDDISNEDALELYNNVMESDLYEYIMKFVSAYQSLLGYDDYSSGLNY